MEKKQFFIPMLLLLVLGCKDKDETIIPIEDAKPAANGFPKSSKRKFSGQGGSEVLEWTAYWADISLLNEYPASYLSCYFEEPFTLPEGFCNAPDEYATKHPIVWTEDTLKGEWFRIIKKYDIPEGVVVNVKPTLSNKTIIELAPNTTGKGRVLMFQPSSFQPVFILQDKMED